MFKKIFKKADAVVKTSEAWMAWALIFWGIGGTTLTAAGVRFWQSASQVGWEYYAIVGIPIFIILAFVLQFFIFRHRRNNMILERIESSENSQKNKAPLISAAYPVLDKRLNELESRIIERLNTYDQEIDDLNRKLVGEIANRAELSNSILSEVSRGVDDLFKSKKQSDAVIFGQLAQIQSAKSTLYMQQNLLDKIHRLQNTLDSKEPPSNFTDILNAYVSSINEWVGGVAKSTRIDISDPTKVDSHLLKSINFQDWVKDIEDTDLQLDVKRFSVIKDQFAQIEKAVLNNLKSRAYADFNGFGADSHFVDKFRN